MDCPEDSIQNLFDSWWEVNEGAVVRGSLVKAYVFYPEQEAYILDPVGRKKPTEHTSAEVKIKKFRLSERTSRSDLPVAALTLLPSEQWAVLKGKVRPCLIIGKTPMETGLDVKQEQGMAKHAKTSPLFIAPFYGADQDGSRGGFPLKFVEGIRHARCPQLFADYLPDLSRRKVKTSILRFDHIQPIGDHYNSYKSLGYKLSEDALEVIDTWYEWYLKGGVQKESYLYYFMEEIKKNFYS
jgi:hypothetical protein